MKNQLRGCVKISAEGRELYRFINMIHRGHICCFGQYCRKDIFYAELYRHDLPKVEDIAAECGISLTSREFATVSTFLLRYRRRIGIVLGAVLVLFTALYFSNVVVTIDIQGNSKICDEDILSALGELGIKPGARISSIDLTYCSNELRVKLSGISWAGIRRTGNRIVVEVTEITEPPESPAKRLPCNIVSSKNAKITAFTLHDGFLMHKIGDYVREGTLLVSGVTVSPNGRNALHHAMGEIIGVYEEKVTFSGSYRPTLYVPTGRSRNQRSLKLFSANIPLYLGRNRYSSCGRESTYSPLQIFGKELPIGIVKEHITETKLSENVLTEEQLEEQLRQKIFLYEKNFIGEDTKILSRDIQKERSGEGITLTVTYSLEGNIGEEKEILLK